MWTAFVFKDQPFLRLFLTMVRLAVSGLILSGMAFFSNPQKFLSLFKNKKDMLNAFIFSVFGCMAVQYSYFAAIEGIKCCHRYYSAVYVAYFRCCNNVSIT